MACSGRSVARPAGCALRRRATLGRGEQAILGRGRWETDALRDVVRDYALETLADPDAVLVIDETGFLKQGRASCGVGLLSRRSLADGKLTFFTTWCPAGTSADKLVQVEGCRWAIEDSFETARAELGPDHNETRSWHGWHRHVSLVTLAFAMMAAIRHHANQPAPQKHRCA